MAIRFVIKQSFSATSEFDPPKFPCGVRTRTHESRTNQNQLEVRSQGKFGYKEEIFQAVTDLGPLRCPVTSAMPANFLAAPETLMGFRLDGASKAESAKGGRRVNGLCLAQEDLAMITICFRHGLIFSHIRQVQFLARRSHLRCPQVELDDLRSICLIHAVDRFGSR
jgi:hypothetical protein